MPRIRFVTEEGGRAFPCDLGGLGQGHRGVGIGQVRFEDGVHLLGAPRAGRVAPGLGRAQGA